MPPAAFTAHLAALLFHYVHVLSVPLELVVRDGKGLRFRVTMLPQRLVDPLRSHLERVRAQLLSAPRDG